MLYRGHTVPHTLSFPSQSPGTTGTSWTGPMCPTVEGHNPTALLVPESRATVGYMGPVRDVLVCPGTLGREGQWDCGPPLWDTWDLSGISRDRDGKDSGIVALHYGTHGTCPGCPWGPRTLGREGQWDSSIGPIRFPMIL